MQIQEAVTQTLSFWMSHFDYLLLGAMGYAIIYMGMIVALALVEYRKSGLLKHVQATPVSPAMYLGSHIVANMIIATAQGFIVLLVALLLGFEPLGGLVGLLLAGLFLALLAIAAVGLGLITPSVSKDTGAAGGHSVISVVPMMMFGALLAVLNETTRNIARFMPNYYVSDSLPVIFHTGSLSDRVIVQNLLILAGISLFLVVAGMQIFKRATFQRLLLRSASGSDDMVLAISISECTPVRTLSLPKGTAVAELFALTYAERAKVVYRRVEANAVSLVSNGWVRRYGWRRF